MVGPSPFGSFFLLDIGYFFLPQKDYLTCFVQVLKVSLIQKRGFYPLRILTLEFSVFLPLQGIAPGNNCLGGVSLKDYKIIQKIKKGNENQIILGDFNCTMDKLNRDAGNKTQRICRCCSNYSLSKLIMDNGLEDLWRRENPGSEFTLYNRSSETRSRINRVYADIKIASNTKINHMMVSFTDHYNAIFIDRLPSKSKIGKDSWHFNNSLLWKPKFSSATKN